MIARIPQVLFGYIQSQSLFAAVELGVADALLAGPLEIGALAEEVGAQPEILGRLLDVLVHLGLFSRTEDGRYAHNDASAALASGHPNSMADLIRFCGVESYRTFGGLVDAVREGGPVFDKAWGQPFWDHLQANPERAAMFNRAMERQSELLIRALCQVHDFTQYRAITDVGGGRGQFFRPLRAAGVAARCTVMDLPRVAPQAEAFFAEEGLTGCTFVGGSFFDGVPGGADLYTLKFVLHDWNDADSVRILDQVRAAMQPGAKVMVIEKLLGQDPSPAPYLSDMLMLTTFGAKERTAAALSALLTEAGFAVQEVAHIQADHWYVLAGLAEAETAGA